ncbi:MAG: ABC transporter substrate-binding protein [Propionibacteriaceae bacterium]|nr:ABC transporter substrate-binding protein [Propionibacteriaceae bacterium]
MTHTKLLRLAAIGVAAFALTACQAAQPSPSPTGSTKLTIGLTYQPDIQFAPIYVAEQQGFFAQAGLDVTIRHHGASESLFGALQAGEEDVVFAGGDEMLQAKSQGVDVVNIATVYQTYPVAVLVPENSTISTAADLRGHSIGLPGEYGENWFALLLLLKQAGLTTADVTVVSIGYTQQAALMSNKVDAVVGFTNNDAVRFAQSGFSVRPITLSPLAGQASGLVGAGLGTSSSFLASNTPALRAMWGAIAKAMQVCIDAPQQAITAAKAYVPGLDQADNAAMALATLQATTPLYGQAADFGQQDTAEWASMVDFMNYAGLLAGQVDATDAYTTAVVPPIQS